MVPFPKKRPEKDKPNIRPPAQGVSKTQLQILEIKLMVDQYCYDERNKKDV